MKLSERFWSKVKKSNGCWEWQACISTAGYGKIGYKGKSIEAHRISYELSFGEIPNGMSICHSCDNRKCVRPDHLFVGSHRENMMDAKAKGRMVHGDSHWMVKYPELRMRGSSHPKSRLIEEEVSLIRLLSLVHNQKFLAKQFNVSEPTISEIVTNKRWKHVN